MKNTITVAIPVYNGSRFITKTLESIVNQTVKVDQIFVSDNCSTDNTVQVVKEFAKSHKDINIRINENESNLGYQRNYNKCMELAESDYLLLLSSDDLLKPFAVDHQLRFLEDNTHIALVGGQVDFIDENNVKTRVTPTTDDLVFHQNQIMEFILATNAWINPATVLLDLKKIHEIGFWDESTLGPDERWWPKILTKYPIAIRGESVLDFRRHKGQTGWEDSAKKYNKFIEYLKANIQLANMESNPERRKKTRKHLKKWAAQRCITVGKIVWMTYKRPWNGLKYFWFGFRHYPPSYFSKYFAKTFVHCIISLKDINKCYCF